MKKRQEAARKGSIGKYQGYRPNQPLHFRYGSFGLSEWGKKFLTEKRVKMESYVEFKQNDRKELRPSRSTAATVSKERWDYFPTLCGAYLAAIQTAAENALPSPLPPAYAQFPFRKIGSRFPSAVSPSMLMSAEPIMKSTCVMLLLSPYSSSSSWVMAAPFSMLTG